MEETTKIRSFTDLNAWKEGHKLVLSVYSLTKKFPKEEIFALSNQMRRCVVSITSNIAEGFSRQTAKEKVQFYCIAQGSVTELQNQLLISRDVGFISQEKFSYSANLSVDVHKLVSGLMRSAQNRGRNT